MGKKAVSKRWRLLYRDMIIKMLPYTIEFNSNTLPQDYDERMKWAATFSNWVVTNLDENIKGRRCRMLTNGSIWYFHFENIDDYLLAKLTWL